MLLLLLIYVVLRALWKIDVYLISTLVNKSLYLLSKISKLHDNLNEKSSSYCYLRMMIMWRCQGKVSGKTITNNILPSSLSAYAVRIGRYSHSVNRR